MSGGASSADAHVDLGMLTPRNSPSDLLHGKIILNSIASFFHCLQT